MKPLSIKLRLSLLASLLTLTIILIVSIVAYVEVQESLLRNVDEILRAMGEGIVAAFDEHENPEARAAEFRAIVGSSSKRRAWCRIWIDGRAEDLYSNGVSDLPDRTLLTHSPSAESPAIGASSFFNIVERVDGDDDHQYRVLWMRRLQDQEVVNVLVGRSSHYVYHELAEFYQLLLIVGISLTFFAFLAAPILISWGLRPVAQAGAQLQSITYKNLKQAQGRSETVPELRPFMTALDEMLARLDKAARQQEQFVADAAHELRTPVAVIKSTLQTARLQRRNAAEYEQGIDESLQDLGRLERLIEQLLSLARLEEMNAPYQLTDVCLNRVLEEIIRMFDARAAQRGGRIVFSASPVRTVKGDESQLRQLFCNLLDNALRYGPAGGTVSVRITDGPDNCVTVFVHDEGGEVPPDAVAHLFDRFYRVDSSRAQASGGSGLGLAIVWEIVRRHDGEVTITSDPQAGTQVTVHLPKC